MYYATVGISELEIPSKKSLVIYISECQVKCEDCHTPYLHERYGDKLCDYFEKIFFLYFNYFEVLCLMGEGKCTTEDKKEIKRYCDFAHKYDKQFALYSGRDCEIENWMIDFDYIKVGSYKKELGPLTSKTTNQKFYVKKDTCYIEKTNLFWNIY